MGVTPVYGFPYPALTDSPDGPAQIQALAEAVEADLQVTDANIATLNALGPTYTKLLGGQRRTADTGDINTVETQFLSAGSISLPASSWITVDVICTLFVSVGSDDFHFKIRETNVGGTLVAQAISPKFATAAVPYEFQYSFRYKTTTAESKTWIASVVRFSGSGNIVLQGGTRIIVRLDGPSSLISDTP